MAIAMRATTLEGAMSDLYEFMDIQWPPDFKGLQQTQSILGHPSVD